MSKNIIFRLFLAFILTNVVGITLRYFNLDDYIILLGFRFHLSLLLPALIFIKKSHLNIIKDSLIHPKFNKTYLEVLWIILPIIIILSILYMTHNIGLSDPDYFYEFGLSSIVDYPIYLIWNLAQLITLSVFLIVVKNELKYGFWGIAFSVFLIFLFEFLPIGRNNFNLLNIITVISAATLASLIINYFQNVYWFSIIFFTLFWENILAFGSNSKMLINILFAAQYHSWEGFFDVNSKIGPYLIPLSILLATLIIYLSYCSLKKRL